MDRSLKLSEKLFCLAVNPDKGGIFLNASAVLGMTLSGSVFVELINNKLLSIEKGIVHIENSSIQDDEIHEFFMSHIRLRGKDRKLRNWISVFNMKRRKIQKLFIRNLVQKNVLRTEEKRILFIPYEKVFLMDRGLVENIRKSVENASVGVGITSDDMLILSVLVAKTNLLFRIFPDRARRKEAARYLKKLPENEISKAVQQAIDMMHAAAIVSAT